MSKKKIKFIIFFITFFVYKTSLFTMENKPYHHLADGTFINSGELFVGKFPNTTANQFTSTSVNVVGGLPTGAGNGDVQLQIAAIMQDVA